MLDRLVVIADAVIGPTERIDNVAVVGSLVDGALDLNPSYGRGWYVRGMLKARLGQHRAAIEDIENRSA